jgi:hypothetical protein
MGGQLMRRAIAVLILASASLAFGQGKILSGIFNGGGTATDGGGGGGGGISVTSWGGSQSGCKTASFPTTLNCPTDSGTIGNGDAVVAWIHTSGDSPTFTALDGAGTFSVIGHGTDASGSLYMACAQATGSTTATSVKASLTGDSFLPRLAFLVVHGTANFCASQGSNFSGYSTTGTLIDTANPGASQSATFTITNAAFVVALGYGVNGGTPGGITPGSGWTSPYGSPCDNSGNAFMCPIYKQESGTSTDPNASQSSGDSRIMAAMGLL